MPRSTSLLLAMALLLLPGCTPTDADRQARPSEPWNWSETKVRTAVDHVRAGRDFTPSSWPGGARVAVLFSFDVDNETLKGLQNGEVSVGPLSQGQYGSRVGLPRIVSLLDAQNVPATFFFPAWSLKLAPEQAKVVLASDRNEIGAHGWIHESNTTLDGKTEERLLRQSMTTLEKITGTRPVGYRAPAWDFSPHTMSILRELGLSYDSSLMADDRPYELVQDGERTGIVELPVEWILDDAPLLNPRGDAYTNPRDLMQVWIDEFDKAWEEKTMFLLTMHPHISGHRSRMVALEGLIKHMKAKGGVWFGTHEEAASYVRHQARMDE